MAYTKDQQDYATAIHLAKQAGRMDLVQKYTQAQSLNIPFGETESRIKQFASADAGPKDDWGDYFTNINNYDANREQLLKYRQAGISRSTLEHGGGIDLGGGYIYNPFDGSIRGENFEISSGAGYDKRFDPRGTQGSTKYNGFVYTGQYDPNVIGSITEEDWNAATANRQSWLDEAIAQNDQFTESSYLRDLQKAGGLAYEDSPIRLDTSTYQDSYQKQQDKLYNEYQNYLMEDAYASALKRYQGDPDLINKIRSADYTDYYKSLENPSSSGDMFDIWLEQYSSLVPPKQEQAIIPIQPKTEGLEAYSQQRDQLMASGASQEQLDSLRSAYTGMSDSRTPQTTPTASTPAQPQQPVQTPAPSNTEPVSNALTMDMFKSFLPSLDSYIKSLTPTQNKPLFSLTNNMAGDTGMRNSGLVPTTPKSFYSSTPYTGKAGQPSESTSTNQQALWR